MSEFSVSSFHHPSTPKKPYCIVRSPCLRHNPSLEPVFLRQRRLDCSVSGAPALNSLAVHARGAALAGMSVRSALKVDVLDSVTGQLLKTRHVVD